MTQAELREKLALILQRYAHVPAKDAVFLVQDVEELTNYATEAEMLADTTSNGNIAFAADTDKFYFRRGATWEAAANPDAAGVTIFTTEALLLAATPVDSTIAYAQDTDKFWFRRNGAWNAVPNAAGVAFATTEALSFPIDYNLVGAVDPAPGTVFSTQAEITAYLVTAGTTAFKHIMECYRALPVAKMHRVTFNIAAGIHRPKAGETSFAFMDFGPSATYPSLYGPTFGISILGPAHDAPPPSNWEAITTVQTVTSIPADPANPRVVVSGTPFTAGALKGYYAIGSNWSEPCIIHDNTNNTLYLTTNANTVNATTIQVFRPSAILRNSIDDVTSTYAYIVKGTNIPSYVGETYGTSRAVHVENVTIEPWTASYGVLVEGPSSSCKWVLVDAAKVKNDFAKNFNGTAFSKSALGAINVGAIKASELERCSFRGTGVATVPVLAGVGLACKNITVEQFNVWDLYFGGGANGVVVEGSARIDFFGLVVDAMSGYAILVNNNANSALVTPAHLQFRTPSFGVLLRSCLGGISAAYARLTGYTSGTRTLLCEGLTGPALLARDYCDANLLGMTQIANRVIANTDYGIRVVGPYADVKLPSACTVSGTLGEILFDTATLTYAQAVSEGPVIGATSLNRLQKA